MKLHLTLFCVVLISLVFAASCSPQKPNRYVAESKKEVQHPNKLILKIAESLRPIETERGFSINPQEKLALRYAINFSVSVYSNRDAQPETSQFARRAIGNRVILFRQSDEPASGASGDEIIRKLTAWEKIPNGYILYEQSTPETHFAEHDFDLLWHVAEGAMIESN
jgi:hypothetical protein